MLLVKLFFQGNFFPVYVENKLSYNMYMEVHSLTEENNITPGIGRLKKIIFKKTTLFAKWSQNSHN